LLYEFDEQYLEEFKKENSNPQTRRQATSRAMQDIRSDFGNFITQQR
jgi:hypothetical protein